MWKYSTCQQAGCGDGKTNAACILEWIQCRNWPLPKTESKALCRPSHPQRDNKSWAMISTTTTTTRPRGAKLGKCKWQTLFFQDMALVLNFSRMKTWHSAHSNTPTGGNVNCRAAKRAGETKYDAALLDATGPTGELMARLSFIAIRYKEVHTTDGRGSSCAQRRVSEQTSPTRCRLFRTSICCLFFFFCWHTHTHTLRL